MKPFIVLLLVLFLLAGCAQPTAQPTQPNPSRAVPATVPAASASPAASSSQAGPTAAASATAASPSAVTTPASTSRLTYPIVDTAQSRCYDAARETACPAAGAAFYGQDAQFAGSAYSYTNNNNGTITDNVTGLSWQQSPDTNADGKLDATDKLTYAQAQSLPAKLNAARYGGYSDWRLPTIKELYSLILFDGMDVSACQAGTCTATPFIHTGYFTFAYGDSAAGERTIDSQYLSSTLYVNKTAQGGQKLFGVNFADGRIKGYDLSMPGGSTKTFFVLCVRGNSQYGKNSFSDNGDGSISDAATGLTWSKSDSVTGLDWQSALAWVQKQNAANYLGHSDWRLPSTKELQSILDYSRSPDSTASAAIDPLFSASQIKNEAGQVDYPAYWTGTTHVSSNGSGGSAAYLNFGRALGYMNNQWVDVHGAGAQRSDPKSGSAAQFPTGHGPQGDAIRILNYVRLVRGGSVTASASPAPATARPTLAVQSTGLQVNQPSSGSQANPGAGTAGPGAAPQEALAACTGQSAGAACSFSIPSGKISGTCQQPPNTSVLACVPAGGANR